MRIHAAEGEVSCPPVRATRATRARLRSLVFGESASCRSSPFLIPPSYRRCEDATLLVRLGGTPSSTEIMSWVKICGTYELVGCGE